MDLLFTAMLVLAYMSHIANIGISKPLDLSSLQADYGTYAVGVRHIKIGEKKLDATVYYPVD